MKLSPFDTRLLARFICFTGFFFWCTALTLKYYYFGFYDWDFALYSQTMWSLCHGTTSVSLFGTNFLADHAHYIAFVITPIYFIFCHPLTLLYLEVLSFFTGAYILYKLAEKLTSDNIAAVLMLIYIFHPANIFMLLYEFHFESLAIGLIFLLFYFQYLERYRSFIVTSLLLMLVKENMSVIVFMLGVYGLLFKPAGRIKWGAIPLVLGFSMFILTMFVLTPMVRQNLPTHQNIYWGLFQSLGDSPGSILRNLFFNPGIFLKQTVTLQNLNFMIDVFGGFLGAAILGPSILMVGSPLFLQNLLSNNTLQHTIFYHYAATLVPFVSIAAIYGFAFLIKNTRSWFYHSFLALSLVSAIHSFIIYLPSIQKCINLCDVKKAGLRQAFIDQIPPEAGVVASFIFLSHLSHRKSLYALYNVWTNKNYFTGQHPFIVPSTVHFALIDFNEPWLLYEESNPRWVFLQIYKFLLKGGWKIKYVKSGIVLFERQ